MTARSPITTPPPPVDLFQAACMKQRKPKSSLFPAPPMDPKFADLPFDVPPPELAYNPAKETEAQQIRYWRKKNEMMKG